MNLTASHWVEYLALDRAYVQSVLFTTHAFFDCMRGARLGIATMRHLSNSLTLLRENLLRHDLATSDPTIAVVLSLAMAADVLGDVETAGKHVEGMFQLVKLRGGITALKDNKQLQAKVCR